MSIPLCHSDNQDCGTNTIKCIKHVLLCISFEPIISLGITFLLYTFLHQVELHDTDLDLYGRQDVFLQVL